MKLERISIKNFRCYSSLTVDLHPQLTVLVANNGEGKTTVMDAIRIALWPYVSRFDLARSSTDLANNIQTDDIMLLKHNNNMARQLPCTISLTGDYGEKSKTWTLCKETETTGSRTKEDKYTKQLKTYAKNLQNKVRDVHIDTDLPIFGYYGTGRLWQEKQITKNKRKESETDKTNKSIRTFAYRDCLNPLSDYKYFKDWYVLAFVRRTDLINRALKATEENNTATIEGYNPMMAMQKAIDIVLKPTGWKNLDIVITNYPSPELTFVLEHPEKGILKLDQMSHGIKNIIAMIGDIAYRCELLNPHLTTDAITKTKGVVMIDEIDMHLHPKWQQTVVSSLTTAFPNIQFIITTHSPQVLSTVEADSIRLLKQETDQTTGQLHTTVEKPLTQSRGVASSDILAMLMNSDPVPDVEEAKWLSDYKALIQQNQHDTKNAQRLWEKLIAHFGEKHQEILECERLIRLAAMKQRLHQKNKRSNLDA